MKKYELRFKKSVSKDLRSIPNSDIKKILNRINSLGIDPRPFGCEKLTTQDRYRIRQGVYRIIYEIIDETLIIHVIKVGHRRDVYNMK